MVFKDYQCFTGCIPSMDSMFSETVFDAMHLLPLNVVKNHIERWITQGHLDKKDFNTNLSKMPWTVGN